MQSETDNILILGGGIGGLALALALKQHGMEATVCERAPVLREVGAGLLLTPNATWILQRLGLLDVVMARGHLTTSWRILGRQGRVLQRFRSDMQDVPSINLTRAALLQVLEHQTPASHLLLGHEAVAVEKSRDGTLSVRFANGAERRCRLLVGADGGRSLVRKTFFSDAPPRYCGYVGWRALVDVVPPGWEDGVVTESWAEGCRFGIAPVSGERTYWYATENVPAGWSISVGKRKGYLLDKFQSWHDPIRSLIEATPEDQILLNDISDHASLPQWYRENVALLGDAAHLMSPNLGQGAAMAIEDAWVLAGCLARHGVNDHALKQYQDLRKWRAAWVVWQSRQLGRVIQIEAPALWKLRNVCLWLTPDWLGARSLAPVFNFRA